VIGPLHLVLGVGNEYGRDDAVGLAVARRLAGHVPAGVTVVECEQEPSRLIDAWAGAATALVVDAVHSGAPPGTLHRFDASTEPIPTRIFRTSTHAFGVGDAIELSRVLGTLPPHVVVHGVEGGAFGAGVELSAEVAAALEPAAAAVLSDLSVLVRKEESCTSGR
jgi:hydrogenase maturation protease